LDPTRPFFVHRAQLVVNPAGHLADINKLLSHAVGGVNSWNQRLIADAARRSKELIDLLI
jgi:hypothetical protein